MTHPILKEPRHGTIPISLGDAVTLVPLQQPIDAEVTIPSSKSYTIRALLLAALTPSPVRIENPLFSDDTNAMVLCLQTLGISIEIEESALTVFGSIQDISKEAVTLNADLSAASIRFLLALCCVVPGVQILHGQEGLNKRPVKDLVDALRQMGADIEYLEREGYPPVQVNSNRLKTSQVSISGSMSSQYTSALLMIAPAITETTCENVTVEITGELISKPYLEMTLSIMEAFGVTVDLEGEQRLIIPKGQTYQIDHYAVEADASSAAYFLAIAALTHSRIQLKNLNPNSAQADMRFIEVLEQMGNRVIRDEESVTIKGQGVCPLQVNMCDCPDQAQTLAVLAAFAPGITRITGLQSLRVKETDRIAAVQQELAKMGIRTEAKHDELTIYGGNPKAACIDTYGDHRMAMSFAVAGTALQNVKIHEPLVVGKTFPTFWQTLQEIGIQVQLSQSSKIMPRKIVLIGFMGSGKSSLAPALAEKLQWQSVDMDTQIIARSNYASVSELFSKEGENVFRALEHTIAESLRKSESQVISAGGGVVMNPQTRHALCENSITIFLKTELETVFSRIGEDTTRPLFQNKEQAKALYQLRLPLYEQFSDIQISTDGKTPSEILEAVLEKLQEYKLQTYDGFRREQQ